MKDAVQLSAELGDLLCDILSTESELVTKWVAVAEVIGSDGRRWLRTFWPDRTEPWDGIGMMTVAIDDLRAAEYESKDEDE